MTLKKAPPASRISEVDRLTLVASTATTQRCNAQYQLHAERAEAAKEAAQKQAAQHKATVEGVFKRYALSAEADSINLESGEIVRAPAAAQPDVPVPPATTKKKES